MAFIKASRARTYDGLIGAAALIRDAESAVAGRADRLELTVLEGNDRAIAFYAEAGIEAVADLGAAHGPAGKSAILMRLPVDAAATSRRA